jgi:hypothetical protein
MDLDTTTSIILRNCMELFVHNTISVIEIIILSALSVISRVASTVVLLVIQYKLVLHVGRYFSRFQSE